jgi:Bax protein
MQPITLTHLLVSCSLLVACGFPKSPTQANTPTASSSDITQNTSVTQTTTTEQTNLKQATSKQTADDSNTDTAQSAAKPVISNTNSSKKTAVQIKKERFIAKMLPACQQVHQQLTQLYQLTEVMINADPEQPELVQLRTHYNVKSNAQLLLAIKPHPISITLAQAAMESAWGTSRFFNDANNIFGIWSFNASDQRIAAGQARDGKTIWVKKYDNLEQSIYDYYKILAKVSAYSDFRAAKASSDDPFVLLKKLNKYSERGELYTKEIAKMIAYNQFNQYDSVN